MAVEARLEAWEVCTALALDVAWQLLVEERLVSSLEEALKARSIVEEKGPSQSQEVDLRRIGRLAD
jgi:hypothetical protein